MGVHTKMSDAGSIISAEELINWVKAQGMTVATVTDENSVQAFPEFARLTKKAGIKPIFGAKIIHRDVTGRLPFTATVLVKNQAGLKNLYRVISALRVNGVCKKITFNVLNECRDGLLIGSGGANGMLYGVLEANADAETTEKIAAFYDYFEIQSFYGTAEEQNRNRHIVELAKRLGKPVVAVSDGQYIDEEDAVCLDILHDFQECNHSRRFRMRTAEELMREFYYLGEIWRARWFVIIR